MKEVIGLPLGVAGAGIADGQVASEQEEKQEGRGVRTPARQRRSATALLSSHRGGAEDGAGGGGCSGAQVVILCSVEWKRVHAKFGEEKFPHSSALYFNRLLLI